jgi:sortase A
MSWGRRPAQRFRPSARVLVAGAGLAAIGTGIGIVAQIGVFYYHSSTAGRNLVSQERKEIARAARSPTACQAPLSTAAGGTRESAAGQGPAGLLDVPSLGMLAPVLQGTGDSVLSDAVGHDPASVWPGQAGTSVLSAHDVTWFSRIGRLKPGNEIRYITPCRTYTYRVTSHVIVTAGSPVYTTGTARLVLDTCYPLDALYLTSTRYLVYADLIAAAPTHATAAAPREWAPPAVPAPAPLAAQGLDLAHNPAPLGTLSLIGSPSRAWTQSSAPLDFHAAALAEYFGIIRSAAQQRRDWWAALAPSVPTRAAGPLWGGRVASYVSHLMITLRAAGNEPVQARLTATVAVTGPHGPGRYNLTVTETVKAGKLLVTGAQLTPA